MPVPYGWDANILSTGAGLSHGSSSVPTTPLQSQIYPNPQPHNFGMNLNSHVPAPYQTQNANIIQNQFPVNSSAINKSPTCDTTSPFNLVPNLDFIPPPHMAGANFDKTSPLEPDFPQQQNNDLIQLGFEGILTSDEKEYFSLEYFDPLHKKGRTTSVASPKDLYINYSFAKPPEDETDKINEDTNAWVTFEDDFLFGEGISDKSASKDDSLPKPTPHGRIEEKADSLKVMLLKAQLLNALSAYRSHWQRS